MFMEKKVLTFRRIMRAGIIAVIISTIINIGIMFLARAVFKPAPEADFKPLTIGPVLFWSVVCGIGAVLVFNWIVRTARQPLLIYLLTAIIVYALTFVPDGLLLTARPPVQGATPTGIFALMLMHVAEATIMILTFIIMLMRNNPVPIKE